MVADGDLGPEGPMIVGIRGSGRKPDSPYPVFGRLGGGYGRGEYLMLNGVEIPHGPQQALGPGDRLSMALPGGGGFGLPKEREPERVARDVRLGYVTVEAALEDYGVVVDTQGVVDAPATGKARTNGA